MRARTPNWETHLVSRALAGESVAFELICDEYRPALMAIALRMLRNADDAHDAIQETFVKAIRGLRDFHPEKPLKPWLCRICANCCVDIIRSRRRVGLRFSDVEFALPDPSDEFEERTFAPFRESALLEAIGRLPENYKRIILMRHFRQMDILSIAAELEKPVGTVKSWLFRARTLLRKDLQIVLQ